MELTPESLYTLRDAAELGVIDPRQLPQIATEALVDGLDSQALRELAGLDLGPFTTPDAVDLLLQSMTELGAAPEDRSIDDRNGARVLAHAALEHNLDTKTVLQRFYRLAVALDYPDDDDLMALFGLDDEWLGDWGRSRAEMEAETWDRVRSIAAAGPALPSSILAAAARSV